MDGEDIDPRLPDAPVQARNYVLACYTVALIRGETIKGLRIKLATLNKYVTAAVKIMSACQVLGCDMNPRNSPIDYVTILLDAVHKYEGVKRRREMIYDDMFHDMLAHARLRDPDGREAAILDWLILSRYTGFRAEEYCQKATKRYEEVDVPPRLWEGERTKAFIASDFEFFDERYRPLSDITTHTDISSVRYVRIRWRWQKNLDHGECIPYERDLDSPAFCPVRAALRIYQRALRLDVRALHPIGVFRRASAAGGVPGTRYQFLRGREDIQAFIRASAARVFGLSSKDPALTNWTSHSPRVTACNLLHRQNVSDSYIQQRLRWRSDAFKVYLRNNVYSAARHRQALLITPANLPTLRDSAGNVIPRVRPASEEDEITRVLRVPVGGTTPAA